MRIALVTLGDPSTNPRCRPLATVLERAGHEVTVVSPAVREPLSGHRHVHAMPTRFERVRSRIAGSDARAAAVARTADDLQPDLVYPLRERDLGVVESMAAGHILSPPGWRQPRVRDFVWAPLTQQGVDPDPADAGGAVGGGTINLVARFTATTPARYLGAAFERIGFDVARWDGGIDWDSVAADSILTVFVESPYPALEIAGEPPKGVPVLFWVHHGEHHQAANVRLADRYGAGAVMMAHSWHLAHQYRHPVFALPFGVPTELIGPDIPFDERPYDVAMVGAGLEATDGWYERRGSRVGSLQDRADLSTRFAYGLEPTEMLQLYQRSRVVINDGGRQHHPITMRIFEAFGAGAALATEPAPGLQSMFTPGEDFAVLHSEDAEEIVGLMASGDLAQMASRAHTKALADHTYDQRARSVVAIAGSVRETATGVAPRHEGAESPVVACIADDVDVQSILVAGTVEGWMSEAARHLADRDIRMAEETSDIRDRSFDAVVLGSGADPEVVEAARSYVYVQDAGTEGERRVAPLLADWHRTDRAGVTRFDARTGGYRVRPHDHPLR